MNFYEVRVQKRITQWDIKKATGIHQSKVSLIERGYVNPSEEEKEKLAKAVGCNVQELFNNNGQLQM